MRTFDCKVLLSGSQNNQVPKFGVTTPEVLMLRHLHGEDAVVNLVERATIRVPHRQERDRLAQIYGEKRVAELFGLSHMPLPTDLPEREVVDEDNEGDADDDPVGEVASLTGAAPRRRGRPPKEQPADPLMA